MAGKWRQLFSKISSHASQRDRTQHSSGEKQVRTWRQAETEQEHAETEPGQAEQLAAITCPATG
jgi:hypothetical protein